MKEETKNKTIKADDYGELLSQIHGMDLVSFEQDGGYQGEYMVILHDKESKRYYYYSDYYGSCSGCDWLEAEKDWDTGEVDYLKAVEYTQQSKPKYITPDTILLEFTKEKYEGFKLK